MNRVQDKVAMVTGGANGIGRAICELLAEEGALVLVADIEQDAGTATVDSIRQAGGYAEFALTDVSNSVQVQRAVERAVSWKGRIDILCNNAAYLSPDFHAAADATEEEWRKSLDITVLGTHSVTRTTLPYMMARRAGSIINVASIQAIEGMMTSVAYTAAKAALLGYTMSLAYDYGPYNIRANSLCPGPIRTRISAPEGGPHHQWQCDQTTLGRTGTPREVAWAALFLAADESSYVSGVTLPVDGGWTCSSARPPRA